MSRPLKILMLEDDPDDAELIQQVIEKGKLQCRFTVVIDRHNFLKSLDDFNPDIILSDNQLPQFDATEALELTRKHSVYLPFIMVTGTVSEEFAANVIRMGADDYILKDRLARLPAAITYAIERRTAEAALIEERKKTEEEILQMNEQLRSLTNHLQNIREEESTRISREIHDQLGQQLTVMKMDMSWIAVRLKEKNPELYTRACDVLNMMDETVRTVRRISADLRPTLLDEIGLGPAIEQYLLDFSKRTGIHTQVTGAREEIDLPDTTKSALFRIVQESLTNIIRHAKASNVRIDLLQNAEVLIISIQDDGVGFVIKETSNKKTFGLLGIKERIAMMKGNYEIASVPGKGTTITLSVPFYQTNRNEPSSFVNINQ